MTNDIKEIQTIQPGLSEIKEIKGELANVKKRKRRSKKINKLTDGQIRINHVSSEKKKGENWKELYLTNW